ncbi:MAG: methylmalonyl-CoA mutase family protein [Synergistaceae bacterium]|jgi:methylmalonyl-CoA mutase N-terminal domain/subunit|nr:methylmalonyl-CoA mutase family protein [Synergistaceae bacterium]
MENDVHILEKARQEWQEGPLAKALAKTPERENLQDGRIYTPLDVDTSYEGYVKKIGFPGQYPMTRGGQATMYRGRFWTMRSYSGFATAKETNERFRYLLKQGVTGLSVAFDMPTQIGYDSDHPFSDGEVGKVGVAIDSLEDMEALFEGIPLDKVSTSMTINSPAAVMLAMYQAVGEKQGVAPDKLRGTTQNDVLKEYIARGTYIYPPRPSMRLTANIFEYCKNVIPNWNTISLGAYHIREAGATPTQEIAFAFANAIEYIQTAIDAGLDIDDFAGRISWIFTADIRLLEEVAKFRAARRLWAKILRERFGAKKPSSWMLRVHVHTSGSVLTAQQPLNNVIRVSLQALGAVMGGTNSMATCAFDEALSIPTEESATLAVRTQQIIAYESGAADVVDPLAGSYYIENMTDRFESDAESLIQKIIDMGGAVAAIERGWMQNEISKSAYVQQMAVEDGKKTVIGVNKFTGNDRADVDLTSVDPVVQEIQIEKKKALMNRRDNVECQAALEALSAACRDEKVNLMPFILRAVKSYATLGEICDSMRKIFGEYEAVKTI